MQPPRGVAAMTDPAEKPKPARAGARSDARSRTPNQPPTAPAEEPAKEIGGPDGPEPTRYGDWERNGRCTDF